MEIQLPFSFTTLMLFSSFIFLLLINIWKKSKSHKKYVKLPPSPPELPVIGHLHHMVGGLPHHVLTKLNQKYGPILYLKLGDVSAVVISSREAAKEVLKVQDPACANKPETIGIKIMWYDYKDIIFSPYNEYWRQMRKICILELLSARNVKSFGFIRQDEASRLVESVKSSSGEAINLTEKVFAFTSSITCRAAFGKVLRDRDTLIAMFRKAIPVAGGFDLADLFPSNKFLHVLSWNKYKLQRMRHKLDEILDGIVEEHKLKQSGEFGGEDILDVLLRMQNNRELESPITSDNIKAVVFYCFNISDFSCSIDVARPPMQLCCSLRVRGCMDAHAGSILPSSIAKLYQKGDADLAAKSDQPKAEVERGTEGVDVKMQTKSNRALQQVGGGVDDTVQVLVAEEESLDQIVAHDESCHSENNSSESRAIWMHTWGRFCPECVALIGPHNQAKMDQKTIKEISNRAGINCDEGEFVGYQDSVQSELNLFVSISIEIACEKANKDLKPLSSPSSSRGEHVYATVDCCDVCGKDEVFRCP
ncbi:hypothetical protein BUALT_Bualt10G0102600 [Buddleja alternifolia]|uniref:Cytochrome P450 n=1 Tax=Buddleja alternifolia TaxID=168488 RepID=A0AAV6WXN2_9LAMI|nr:hypothetical protein BUALT_Bualt10G0102600 [Buddleja alternifolia]